MRTGPWAPARKMAAKLGFEEFRPLERQADGPEAERRIGFAAQTQGGRRLVAAGIEGPDGQGTAAQALHQALQHGELFVLAGQIGAVHIHEFAAQQTDADGAGGQYAVDLGGEFQVGLQRDEGAVEGHRRHLPQAAQPAAQAKEISPLGPVEGQGFGRRVEDELALHAVDHRRPAAMRVGQSARHADDGRQARASGP